MWRDSTDDALPFATGYVASDGDARAELNGDYAHGDVIKRISGVEGGIGFKLIRDGVEEFEDVAAQVGPESYLSRRSATIMQFPRGDDGQVEACLAQGDVWSRVGG